MTGTYEPQQLETYIGNRADAEEGYWLDHYDKTGHLAPEQSYLASEKAEELERLLERVAKDAIDSALDSTELSYPVLPDYYDGVVVCEGFESSVGSEGTRLEYNETIVAISAEGIGEGVRLRRNGQPGIKNGAPDLRRIFVLDDQGRYVNVTEPRLTSFICRVCTQKGCTNNPIHNQPELFDES
jgi:hypothetical protein